MPQHVRDFYVQGALMTSPGRYVRLFDGLPPGVAAPTRVAQGLLLHEHHASAYGVTLSDERSSSVHIRPGVWALVPRGSIFFYLSSCVMCQPAREGGQSTK